MIKPTLLKLHLPESYVTALKKIYGVNTAKAALLSYLHSPISFSCDDFLGLCESLDSMPNPVPHYFHDVYSEYLDALVSAKQSYAAFQIEKDMKHD